MELLEGPLHNRVARDSNTIEKPHKVEYEKLRTGKLAAYTHFGRFRSHPLQRRGPVFATQLIRGHGRVEEIIESRGQELRVESCVVPRVEIRHVTTEDKQRELKGVADQRPVVCVVDDWAQSENPVRLHNLQSTSTSKTAIVAHAICW